MSEDRGCMICPNPYHAKGYCRKHYRAFSKYGDPLAVANPRVRRPERYTNTPEVFWSRVDRSGGSGACWNWTGSTKPGGYGQISWRGRKGTGAHRVALELTGVEIPKGMNVDHLCTNKRCVNPAHLEVVTTLENSRRMIAMKAVRIVCVHGHSLTGDNLRVESNGRRRCVECLRASVAKRVDRRRRAA